MPDETVAWCACLHQSLQRRRSLCNYPQTNAHALPQCLV